MNDIAHDSSTFIVRGISQALADEARRLLRSPEYGHPAHAEIAAGTGPCRCCLRTFVKGVERRLLFTYRPENRDSTLMAPGPIFVHADRCEAWGGAGFPPELRALPLVFESRAAHGRVLGMSAIESDVNSQIRRLLAAPDTGWLHVRHANAGCFIATVQRKGPAVSRGA